MATKKSASRSSDGSTPAQLAKQAERVDRELLRLLNERAKLVLKMNHARDDKRQAAMELVGDQAWMDRLLEAHRGPLDPQAVKAIFRELLSGAATLIRPTRIAFLGPQYSYSHLATLARFGSTGELISVSTIAAVFEEVHRGLTDYGVVPLENSTDGRIADTLEMFAKRPVRICGELPLRIHHNLLGKCPRSEIQEVYSKPQALSQCRGWLAKHLPAARTIEMASTAGAAQIAGQKPGAAAIASLPAAHSYGLQVLAANIEDNPHNVTRFAIIGGDPPPRTGHDKTSLMFEIHHRPGALADAMAIFKRNRLNLTWIESFPLPGSPQEYLFFVECEGHQADARVKRSLESLGRRAVKLEVLGSYPAAPALD